MFEEIKARKIHLAVVGCGRISANHFASIKKYPKDLELVAVCDNSKSVFQVATEVHQVADFRSMSEMPGQVELNSVILCSPSGLHSAQAIEIAAAGRDVISEKPMATRWRDGVDMVKACDRVGVLADVLV